MHAANRLIRLPRTVALATIAVGTFALAGCGGMNVNGAPTRVCGQRVVVETSASKPPDWVTREPESDSEYHYFRGRRTDAPSLEGGETDARHNAMANIIQFLGLRVEVDYERMRTDERTQIRDAIRSVGGADIFGTRLSEMYYVRERIDDCERVRDVYSVSVLVRFPRESVERIKASQRERLLVIQQMMAGPGFMSEPDEIYSQILGAANALEAIEELNRNVLITTETETEALQLRQQAYARLNRLIGGLRLSVETDRPRVTAGDQTEPLLITAHVTADNRGAEAPVPNVPVRIAFGDSVRVIWTDQRGTVEWPVGWVGARNGTSEIVAQIDLPRAVRNNADIARNIPAAATTIDIVPISELITLLVARENRTVEHISQSQLQDFESRLVEALRGEGFRVINIPGDSAYTLASDPWTSDGVTAALAERSGATVVIRWSIGVDTPTPVQFQQTQMSGVFGTEARVRLSLLRVTDGQTLGTIVLKNDVVTDTRGYGGSPESAIANAMELNRSLDRQPNGYRYIALQVTRMLVR